MITSHPSYPSLLASAALFRNPYTNGPVMAPIWSAGVGDTEGGSWVDMTSEAGRKWWYQGVRGLVELGCDGMWK